MKLHFLAGLILCLVSVLVAAFFSLWLPAMYALTPGAFTITKEYHNCREPGFLSSGLQEGTNCYDEKVVLNPPYDQYVRRDRTIFISVGGLLGFFYGLFFIQQEEISDNKQVKK